MPAASQQQPQSIIFPSTKSDSTENRNPTQISGATTTPRPETIPTCHKIPPKASPTGPLLSSVPLSDTSTNTKTRPSNTQGREAGRRQRLRRAPTPTASIPHPAGAPEPTSTISTSMNVAPPRMVKATTTAEDQRRDLQSSLPPKHTMNAQRNDMSLQEKHYGRTLTTSTGGLCRRNYVALEANLTYRCPIPLCPNPHGRGGIPKNSDGLYRKIKTHIEQRRKNLTSAVEITTVPQDGHEHTSSNPPRIRKGLPELRPSNDQKQDRPAKHSPPEHTKNDCPREISDRLRAEHPANPANPIHVTLPSAQSNTPANPEASPRDTCRQRSPVSDEDMSINLTVSTDSQSTGLLNVRSGNLSAPATPLSQRSRELESSSPRRTPTTFGDQETSPHAGSFMAYNWDHKSRPDVKPKIWPLPPRKQVLLRLAAAFSQKIAHRTCRKHDH